MKVSKRYSESVKKMREGAAEILEKVKKEIEKDAASESVDKNDTFIELTQQADAVAAAKELFDDKILMIDFNGQPDLFDEIVKIAKDEIRQPEDQVLYILKSLDYPKRVSRRTQ